MSGDERSRWRLEPFVDFSHFEDECIGILNKEWPRSRTQRETSFRRASNTKPPMALLLLTKNGSELGGHARLCALPQDVNGCWVESVILRDDLRGRGIGRVLMELLEETAKTFGFSKMFLSTEDKQQFYERCGFSCCPPVLNAGANGGLLSGRNLKLFFKSNDASTAKSSLQSTCAVVTNGVAPPAPAPPPPPPGLSKLREAANASSKKIIASKSKQYMVKDLV